MEQATPNGFKPNYKYKECKRCHDQRMENHPANYPLNRDYLNEFQVCNSCCKQMEQATPSGFKPNYKYEECERCVSIRDYLNEFQVCNSCCNQATPSGFKPNYKFEKCKGCKWDDLERDYL